MRALALALLLAAVPAGAAMQGAPAPAFTLDGRDGPVTLAAYKGKFVYIDFWASWCAPCKRSFPWMAQLQKRFAADGLQVLAVNVDARRADAERFLAANPPGFTVAFDAKGATPRQYAIKGMPSSVLVDPDGVVVYQHAGFNEDAAAEIEAHVRAALTKGAP
jgi:thiol-disulfide isomerase/thioredoxin